jgi:hypothetical protein
VSAEVPESFARYFSALYEECKDTLVERQAGYGPTNIEALGPHGVFSRLASDKCARIANSMNGEVVNGKIVLEDGWFNPGVRDALLDIANYALIMIAIGEKKWSVVSREEPSSY